MKQTSSDPTCSDPTWRLFAFLSMLGFKTTRFYVTWDPYANNGYGGEYYVLASKV